MLLVFFHVMMTGSVGLTGAGKVISQPWRQREDELRPGGMTDVLLRVRERAAQSDGLEAALLVAACQADMCSGMEAVRQVEDETGCRGCNTPLHTHFITK